MENIYTIASSSSSTTYGNVMTFFKEFIKKQLPIIGLKDDTNIFMSSEIAYVNIRRRLGRNSLKEFSKLEKPFVNINPQLQNSDENIYEIPLTSTFYNVERGLDGTSMFFMLRNRDNGYGLQYKINRDRIQFEVTITLESAIQQIDVYNYLKNYLTWNNVISTKASLEAMIPREIIKGLGLLENIDIDNTESNQIPVILRLLNKFSFYPITYKIRNGTSLDEFFMYYNENIFLCFENLSRDSVNRKGFADDFYQIHFECWVEFNLPAMFALIGEKPKPKALEITLVSKNTDNHHDLIPLYTISNFYSRYPSERNGFTYYLSFRFKTECNEKKISDTIDLSTLIEEWMIRILKKYLSHSIPVTTLVDPILLQDGSEKPTDWDIDWTKLELRVDHPDNDATYCLIIYINNNLFNEERINEEEEKMVDKPRL